MAISLVGTAQSGNALNGGNITLTFASTQANDLIVVFGGHGAAVTTLATPTPGTGVGTMNAISTHTGTAPICGAWWARVTGSGSVSVTCNGGGSASDAVAYAGYCLRGVDTVTAMDATATTAGPTTSTNPNPAAITTVTNNAWVIATEFHLAASSSTAAPSGYSNLVATNRSDTNPVGVGGGTKLVATKGSEDPGTFTNSSNVSWFTITIAVKPDQQFALTGQAITSSTGTAAPGISVALTGLSMTAATGNVTVQSSDVTVALTGQAITTATGTLSPSTDKALTGQSIAASTGAPAASISVSLTGQALTSALGTLTAAIGKALTGQSASFAQGTAGAGTSIVLVGQSLTASQGAVSAGSDIVVALTGQGLTATTGHVSVDHSAALSGQTITATPGTVTSGTSVALTGQALSASQGTITANQPGDVTVALTGVALTFGTGHLHPSITEAIPAYDYDYDERGHVQRHGGGEGGGAHSDVVFKGNYFVRNRDALIAALKRRLGLDRAEEVIKQEAVLPSTRGFVKSIATKAEVFKPSAQCTVRGVSALIKMEAPRVFVAKGYNARRCPMPLAVFKQEVMRPVLKNDVTRIEWEDVEALLLLEASEEDEWVA